MSTKAVNWAKSLPVKPPTQKFVLECLADYATDTLKSYPTMDTIRRDTGMAEENIEYALNGLIDAKLIRDTGQRVGDKKDVRVFQLSMIVNLPKLTGRRTPTAPEFIEAEEIYRIYPRPVAKPKSLAAISKAIKKYGFEFVKERTKQYAASWKGRTDVNVLCPHSTTFYNQERFNDDPATWGVKPPAAVRPEGAPTWKEFEAYAKEKFGDLPKIQAWTADYFRHWNSAKRNWMRNGKLIEWQIEFSKQIATWREAENRNNPQPPGA